jgi:hypothetical protein
MLVLAIWLFLIGYSVAITGKRNLGVSYRPQPDGSIKPVDVKGNQASTFSLLDVVTCAGPSATPIGAASTAASGPRPGPSSGLSLPSLPPLPPGLGPGAGPAQAGLNVGLPIGQSLGQNPVIGTAVNPGGQGLKLGQQAANFLRDVVRGVRSLFGR